MIYVHCDASWQADKISSIKLQTCSPHRQPWHLHTGWQVEYKMIHGAHAWNTWQTCHHVALAEEPRSSSELSTHLPGQEVACHKPQRRDNAFSLQSTDTLHVWGEYYTSGLPMTKVSHLKTPPLHINYRVNMAENTLWDAPRWTPVL